MYKPLQFTLVGFNHLCSHTISSFICMEIHVIHNVLVVLCIRKALAPSQASMGELTVLPHTPCMAGREGCSRFHTNPASGSVSRTIHACTFIILATPLVESTYNTLCVRPSLPPPPNTYMCWGGGGGGGNAIYNLPIYEPAVGLKCDNFLLKLQSYRGNAQFKAAHATDVNKSGQWHI